MCVTTAQVAKSLCAMGSSTSYRRISKNRRRGTLNFLTQYEEDGNDLLGQIIISDKSWILFYEIERKSVSIVRKKEEEAPRKFKNKCSARQVMLTAS